MSELQNKIIKQVLLKPRPWGQQGYYGHRVIFEDGSKGEIYQCTEATPDWLKEGKNLAFIIKPSNFPDTPFVVTMESIEQEKEHRKDESYTPPSPPNRFQKKSGGNSNYGGYKGYGRYEDSPQIWLKKQKFICMLKMYEVLAPFVTKGDIKYENLEKEVDKHLDHIMNKSEMNSIPPPSVIQGNNIPWQTQIRKAPVAKTSTSDTSKTPPAKREDDRDMHTNREIQPPPDFNPEDYSSIEEPTLFEQDKNLDNTPIPAELAEKIKKCDTKSKLVTLQRSLTPQQVNNKKIMDAFFTRKKEITKKK